MTILSSSILAIEPFFDGVINYFAPNWLLNPDNGLLRSLSYISRTSLGTNYLDTTNRIPIMASGAWFLSMAAMQMLAKDVLQKRAFLKTKLINATLLSIVFLRAAFASNQTTSMLRPEMVGLKAGLQIGNILWIVSDMIRYFSSTKDNTHRTPLKSNQRLFLSFNLLHGLTSAAIMMFSPEKVVGDEGWGFWRKMSSENSQVDEITRFASQIGGAFFLTSVFSILDILFSDPSMERFAWWNTQSVVTHALHSLLFLRSSMHSESSFMGMSILHALLVAASLQMGPTLFGEMKHTIRDEMKQKNKDKTDSGSVPALSDEMHVKKSS